MLVTSAVASCSASVRLATTLNDPRAKGFLKELKRLYCMSDGLDGEIKQLRANERRLEGQLLRVLDVPLWNKTSRLDKIGPNGASPPFLHRLSCILAVHWQDGDSFYVRTGRR